MPVYDTFFLTLHRQSWFQDTLAFYKTTKTMKIDSPSSITSHEASVRLEWISTRILPGVAVLILSIPISQWADSNLPDGIVPICITYIMSVTVLWSAYLAMQYAIPNRNEVKRVTFDEFFQKHLYTSYIVGEGNMYNRWIPDYAKTEADVKKEQQRIATELLNFEQDLWEY